jgi:hypothetical protein
VPAQRVYIYVLAFVIGLSRSDSSSLLHLRLRFPFLSTVPSVLDLPASHNLSREARVAPGRWKERVLTHVTGRGVSTAVQGGEEPLQSTNGKDSVKAV